MLCRAYGAAARGDVAAANQEFTAAVHDARRAHRDKLEHTCARYCRMSPGSYVMHKSLERLAAAPRSQGKPSLHHPETGASCTTDAAKAVVLAAFTAAIVWAHEPATQEESASVAPAHATLAAEWARPGRDAHGLGDEFPFDEVRGCRRSLKNHKAAGCDGIPAELLKYSGGTGVRVLTRLFNAVLSTRCVPSAWRKGIVVHLAKGGDAGDCSNYRPLTPLPMIDKLFAKLLSERIARVARVHDQQYAFRPGRGTLNPLHNLLAVVRQRTQAKNFKATYACFFDAAKAYDSVPHVLLLHCLLQCGVTGPAFAALAAMYSEARRHPAGCGWGQPSPQILRCNAETLKCAPSGDRLLYVIFVDPVLQGMQALPHPDLLLVGPAAARRKLVGQAYADDLAGIAARQQGLQRDVQAVHLHSLRWGWLLNVPKSIGMVSGKRSVCARLGAPELWWDDSHLPTAGTVKYLGLCLESCGGVVAQQAAGAASGWAALHLWLPCLRCQHLSAATKLLVLRSRIVPCMSFGM